MRLIVGILLAATFFAASAQDSSPAIAGIAHVAFRVSDVSRSRDFYRTLGFEQSFEFADPGKPPVSYVKVNDHQFIELYGRTSDAQPLVLMHVCYAAEYIESLWKEYVKRGLSPPEPLKARAGNLLFLFHDPENQIIEFTQYIPGSLHFEDRSKHLSGRSIAHHLKRAATLVRDLPVEQDFFTSKLGFEAMAGGTATRRLRLPGSSGDELDLELATAATKPRIVFAISDPAVTAAELRKRSIAVTTTGDSVSITDPDGTLLVFAPENAEQKSSPKPKE
jgi:catechol 2,3-dioxygenase-like lactoylglutathione lyase family enzyme